MWPPEMLQHEEEFAAFIAILQEHDVRSYLEIGAKFGGTLWRVASAMPKGSRSAFVDFPRTEGAPSYYSMRLVITRLDIAKRPCEAIWGDSTAQATVAKARKFAPFDAVFIDAGHDYEHVSQDYRNYGPMAKKLIAFHDIAFKKSDVPRFWSEIKGCSHFTELKYDQDRAHNGIGILYKRI